MILAALERRWSEDPDLRLGQLLMNVIASNGPDAEPTPLALMEDGELLRRLGAESEEEERYVREEPRKAREGWMKWERDFRQGEAYRKWREKWGHRIDE
jgi:hypothetical protein